MPNEMNSPKKPRRFLPEPIEMSSRSSTDRPLKHLRGPKYHTASKLTANHNVPIAEQEHHTSPSMTGTNESENIAHVTEQKHQGTRNQIVPGQNAMGMHTPRTVEQAWKGHACCQPATLARDESQTPRQRRKFTPMLVETASRSVRGGSRSLNASNCLLQARSESLQRLDKNRISQKHDFSTTPESSFSYYNLQRRYETRRHSFRVPDLPAIPSSCSGSSDESELDNSPPPPSRKLAREGSSNNQARRESCDEEISSYLLSLAAQAAERQLKEQALAAFPNEQVYQPVDHFAIDNEEEDCSPDDGLTIPEQLHHLDTRRNSAADLSSEFEYLRGYKQRAGIKPSSKIGTDANFLPLSESLNWPSAGHGRSMNAEILGKPVENARLATPPMLGTDLIFPQSSSPETTIYESGSSVKQTHITHNNPGLWHALPHQNGRANEGLWMGTCRNNRRAEKKHVPINTMQETIPVPTSKFSTPMVEDLETENSLATTKKFDLRHTAMNEENVEPYPSDDFVTQIYNYLSLGYPCVARYYDHELSKVSGISVAEIRQDDIDADAKGFVFNEGQGIKRDKTSNSCRRWHALRLYIHEWDNERPRVPEEDGNHEKWGVRERKGSWAV